MSQAHLALLQNALAHLRMTPRQLDVLALLLVGRSNKVIARELSLSPETVKEYVAIILRRMAVASRSEIPMRVQPVYHLLLAWTAARRPQPVAA